MCARWTLSGSGGHDVPSAAVPNGARADGISRMRLAICGRTASRRCSRRRPTAGSRRWSAALCWEACRRSAACVRTRRRRAQSCAMGPRPLRAVSGRRRSWVVVSFLCASDLLWASSASNKRRLCSLTATLARASKRASQLWDADETRAAAARRRSRERPRRAWPSRRSRLKRRRSERRWRMNTRRVLDCLL